MSSSRILGRAVILMVLVAWVALPASGSETAPNPAKAAVPLPALAGWRAALIYESDVGIWTVGSTQVFPRFGCPEVFGLDDKGRCTILVSYSGKWTPFQTVRDGKWLGALVRLDLDPHLGGPELYTGGQKGNLFQIRAHHEGDFDTRIVARFPGQEIHTLVGGDLLPDRPGQELLGFSRLGEVWDIRPGGSPGEAFTAPVIARLDGRVRQALALPAAPGQAPWVAATCRFGKLLLLRMDGQGLDLRILTEEPMGLGRLALRRGEPGQPTVLYASRDDGVILRLEGRPEAGDWKRELIYAGPQGPRGVVSGHFHQDPEVETLAVFGYSKRVQLLSRKPGGAFTVETIFIDRDKGHWLSVAELDGRNATDELIGSGYGKRIFLLSRPPGYGLKGVPIDPEPDRAPGPELEGERPLKVAVRARQPVLPNLHPLSYRGGFTTKTSLYETLVRRDSTGRIVPDLAEAWRFEDGGRELVLKLRAHARFHDGTPVDSEAVRIHLKRWVGLPEHAWLRSGERVREITAISDREVRIRFSEPTAFLPDLCAINPCAVRAPGSLDDQGSFVRPIGSGPYRLEAGAGDDSNLHLRRFRGDGPEKIVLSLFASAEAACDALLRGEVDLLADGWYRMVPRPRIPELASCERFDLSRGPGSSVLYLSFRLGQGPTARLELRRRIRGALDREQLIKEVESGFASACTTWAAPSVEIWPPSEIPKDAASGLGATPARPLRILAPDQGALGRAVATQLGRAGLPTELIQGPVAELEQALEEGQYDLRIERTWGIPYDPYISLTARFLPASRRKSAADERFFGVDPALTALVRSATRVANPDELRLFYRQIQRRIDQNVSLIPLYVPERICVARSDLRSPPLDHDLYRLDLTALGRSSACDD